MGYEIIVNETEKRVEVHSDLCDELMDKKDDFLFNNRVGYIMFHLFSEIEEFLKKEEYKDFEVVMCKVCKPEERRDEYDEEYDDFYEEFDEDDEIDDSRCDIF